MEYPAITFCAELDEHGQDVFSNEQVHPSPNRIGALSRVYHWNYGKYGYSAGVAKVIINLGCTN